MTTFNPNTNQELIILFSEFSKKTLQTTKLCEGKSSIFKHLLEYKRIELAMVPLH
jgi:hypothetical protein